MGSFFIGLALLCLVYNQVALESYLEKLPVLTTKLPKPIINTLTHFFVFIIKRGVRFLFNLLAKNNF